MNTAGLEKESAKTRPATILKGRAPQKFERPLNKELNLGRRTMITEA